MAKTREPKRRINKSAWIRAQSANTPAKDVVAKAKAEGIQLSVAQVYTARSSANKSKAESNGLARKRGRPARHGADKDRAELRRLVLAIGFNRADALFSDLKNEFGF